MSPTTRGWISLAAVGAGLIHLALVIEAPALSAVLLALVGIAEFGWGVLVMFDERFVLPRIAAVAVLAPIALWITALALDATSFRPLPLAVATLFELFIAVALGIALRRERLPSTSSTGHYVVSLILATLVVGTLTTLALSATQAGQSLIDPGLFDGEHH